ncbi:MAG: lipid II:glycine glycyltransferase FemX [Gemmobacter sp.]
MSDSGLEMRTVAPAEWPGLAARFADLGFEQTLTYAEAAARRVGAALRLVAVGDAAGRTVAAAAVRIRSVPGLGRGIAWCPAGPLLHPDGGQTSPGPVLAALRSGLVLREGHVLRVRPSGTAFADPDRWAEAARSAGFRPASAPRAYCSSAIDLAQDDATLMRSFDGKWRTDLRFALKSGLGLDAGDDAGLRDRFLRLFAEVKGAKGFRPDIAPEFHFALSGPDYRCEVLIATRNAQDVAGVAVGHSGPCSTYLFGATGPAGRPLRAGYFLTWEALRRSRTQGARWYDLGGIDPAENPDVARFKQRMNGAAIRAEVWQTHGPGPLPPLVLGLERLRARLKGR